MVVCVSVGDLIEELRKCRPSAPVYGLLMWPDEDGQSIRIIEPPEDGAPLEGFRAMHKVLGEVLARHDALRIASALRSCGGDGEVEHGATGEATM